MILSFLYQELLYILLYLPDVRLTILRRRMDVSCLLDNIDGRRLELEVMLYIESNVLVV